MGAAGQSRLQRLLGGWSANLIQVILGVTQQLALVPVLLHFGSGDLLAAWLAVYAAGNLVLVADAGLTARVINRFLAFKSCADSDGRSAQFFAAMQRIYFGLSFTLAACVAIGAYFVPPSAVLGFRAVADFDLSFVIMTAGTLLLLPSNLGSALYRVRALYGRAAWIQCAAMLGSQLAEVLAIAVTGRLTAVAIGFIVPQLMAAIYLQMIDLHRLFPFLARARGNARMSWRWAVGQFRRAFPFAIAAGTEIALQNLPVLLVSAIVVDRIAVAQWGLTRVVAGLVRTLCQQVSLPLAAELGHDRAIGAKDALRRLYARGSALVTVLASLVVAGLLAFWHDFFSLWTRGAIPYDIPLTLTLLLGAEIVSPAILALNYSYYSDRGELLARTKGVQLVAFVLLSLLLTPWLGPLGTALAVVITDVVVQFGFLASAIIWATLERPAKHIAFLGLLMVVVTACGWWLGVSIRLALSLDGFARFVAECALWLFVVGLAASPLASGRLRAWLSDLVPG
jgi:O-antigen/teichoic acid export membrane protein